MARRRPYHSLVVVLLFLSLPSKSLALEPFRLPQGRRCEISSETYQCFNLGEYRELLHMDNDLRYYSRIVPILQDRYLLLEEVNTLLYESVQLSSMAYDLMKADRDRISVKWSEENRARHEAEASRFDFFSIGLLVTAFVVGFALFPVLQLVLE